MDPDWRCTVFPIENGDIPASFMLVYQRIFKVSNYQLRAVEVSHETRLVEAAISVWEKLPRRSPSANRWSNCAPGSFSANRWRFAFNWNPKNPSRKPVIYLIVVFSSSFWMVSLFKMAKHVDFGELSISLLNIQKTKPYRPYRLVFQNMCLLHPTLNRHCHPFGDPPKAQKKTCNGGNEGLV